KRNAAHQTAAAARHGHRVERRGMLRDLKAYSSLPRHDPWIVERAYQGRAAFVANPLRNGFAIFAMAVVGDDLSTERARSFEFGARGVGGHDDDGLHAEHGGSGGHALRVVAGRKRD